MEIVTENSFISTKEKRTWKRTWRTR